MDAGEPAARGSPYHGRRAAGSTARECPGPREPCTGCRGSPGAEPHEHLGSESDSRRRRWQMHRRTGGELAHDPGPCPAVAPGSPGSRGDGTTIPRGRCPALHRPVGSVAHPGESGCAGAEGRETDRDRKPLRRPAAVDRDSVTMKVTVLTGGSSEERDVAFASAVQIVAALRERGHQVAVVDTVTGVLSQKEEREVLRGSVGTTPPSTRELVARERAFLLSGLGAMREVQEADVLFLALHGGRGEDGTVQALLDTIGVPYTGSRSLGSALAMDKDVSKRLFRDAGVPTAPWLMAPVSAGDVTKELGWPVVVKPSKQGSTVGLTVVKRPEDLEAAVWYASEFDDEVMIEQFVPGRELTVGILEGQALPVGEIIPKHEIFDYECKYTQGMSEEIFPADVSESVAAEAGRLSVISHRVLKLGGYSRVDFRLTPDGGLFCLEVNTLPGLTSASLLPKAALAAGIEFADLCERICQAARAGFPPEQKVTSSGLSS